MTFLDGFNFGWGLIVAGTTGFVVLTIILNLLALSKHRGSSDED